jgi:hypothetical protein
MNGFEKRLLLPKGLCRWQASARRGAAAAYELGGFTGAIQFPVARQLRGLSTGGTAGGGSEAAAAGRALWVS